MKRVFIMQSMVIYVLVSIQMFIQEGHFNVFQKTILGYASIFLSSVLISLIVTAVRKGIFRDLDFRESILRTSIYFFPIFYVLQLLGWLYNQGYIGEGL